MSKSMLIWCILGLCLGTIANASTEASSSSSKDSNCTIVIYDMVDCVPFVSRGNYRGKPVNSCCAGVQTVLNNNPACLCQQSLTRFSFEIDLTKARDLPSACGLSFNYTIHCDAPPNAKPATTSQARTPATHAKPPAPSHVKPLAPSHAKTSPPNHAKTPAPSNAKTPSPSPAPAPSHGGAPAPSPANFQAPAPSPAKSHPLKGVMHQQQSGTHSVSASFLVIIFSVVVLAFSF